MKKINNYIFEKFKISKDIKVINKPDIHTFESIIINTLKEKFNNFKKYSVDIKSSKDIYITIESPKLTDFKDLSNIRNEILLDIDAEYKNYIYIEDTFIFSGESTICLHFRKIK